MHEVRNKQESHLLKSNLEMFQNFIKIVCVNFKLFKLPNCSRCSLSTVRQAPLDLEYSGNCFNWVLRWVLCLRGWESLCNRCSVFIIRPNLLVWWYKIRPNLSITSIGQPRIYCPLTKPTVYSSKWYRKSRHRNDGWV